MPFLEVRHGARNLRLDLATGEPTRLGARWQGHLLRVRDIATLPGLPHSGRKSPGSSDANWRIARD
jgi:hypothetical protein